MKTVPHCPADHTWVTVISCDPITGEAGTLAGTFNRDPYFFRPLLNLEQSVNDDLRMAEWVVQVHNRGPVTVLAPYAQEAASRAVAIVKAEAPRTRPRVDAVNWVRDVVRSG